MDASALDRRLQLATRTARAAGRFAHRLFLDRDTLEIEHKGPQDVVSRADREAETLIRRAITAAFPRDGILGEEEGGEATGDGPIWVIDPIDGTACFLSGIPVWCVSIALIEAGEILLGVIYDPNVEELFVAAKGRGARLNGRPIRVSDAASLGHGTVGVGWSTRVPAASAVAVVDRLLAAGGIFQRNGSGALMLAYVAAGRLLGYLEPHINSWDCLAGILLVEEAGGVTNDFLSGDALHTGNPILATTPALHEELATIGGF